MAKKQFRLATVLKIRESIRGERRSALAEAYQALQTIEDQLEQTTDTLNGLKQTQQMDSGPGPINLDRLIDSNRHEMTLRAQEQTLGAQRQQVNDEVGRRRAALVTADRDVKVLEKLREKKRQQEMEDSLKQDAKQLDEMGVQRYSSRE